MPELDIRVHGREVEVACPGVAVASFEGCVGDAAARDALRSDDVVPG